MGSSGGWRDLAIRNEILDAAERLLLDRSFADLKVKDICAEAGVSKPTFYSRFSDKYAIAQWHFTQVCEKSLYQIGRTLSWDEGDIIAVEGIYARRKFYTKAHQESRGYQSISAFGHRIAHDALTETIVDYRGLDLTDELVFQINYWANSTLITVTNWSRKGMSVPPKEFAALLTSCAPRELYELLRDPMSQ